MKVSLIAGVSKNNVIGNNNKLPWNLKSEMKHFRETTTENTIIMGRKTYESIGFPLPKRLSIVITRTPQADDINKRLLYASSIEEAIEKANQNENEYPTAYIIGGTQIYTEALKKNVCDELIISRIPITVEGDAFFPEIPSTYKKVNEEQKEEFTIETYQK